jgi:hypothetical protein
MSGAARDNLRFSSIVLNIVKSAPFQMRVKPADPPPAPGKPSLGKQGD